jgi:nitrate reductase gamma subunit
MMAPVITFIKGPMVWIAFGVFVVGLFVNVWRFFSTSRKKDPCYRPETVKGKEEKSEGSQSKGAYPFEFIERRLQPAIRLFDRYWAILEDSLFMIHPVFAAVTMLFHLLLFIVPIFLVAHNELFRGAFGFSLPSLPDQVADTLTVVLLMCGGFFFLRRFVVRRVRAISTPWDYCVLFLTLMPFITGFLAFHQFGNYPTIMVLHVLSAELVLVLIPFTKLSHMIYFFLYRLLVGSEYSFGQGKRVY